MPQAPTAALSARLDSVRRRLIELELDALVVTTLPNILYLTNFSGSSAIVVVTAEQVLFLTDSRYVAAVSDMRGKPYGCPRLELVEVEGSYDARLGDLLVSPALKTPPAPARVGFEAAHLTVSRLTWLERHVEGRVVLVPTSRHRRSRPHREGCVRVDRTQKSRPPAVGSRRRCPPRSPSGADGARPGARHRFSPAAGRVRTHGVRDDRGVRARIRRFRTRGRPSES